MLEACLVCWRRRWLCVGGCPYLWSRHRICGGSVLEAYLYLWSRHRFCVEGGVSLPLEPSSISRWRRRWLCVGGVSLPLEQALILRWRRWYVLTEASTQFSTVGGIHSVLKEASTA